MYRVYDLINGTFCLQRAPAALPGPVKFESPVFPTFQKAFDWCMESDEHKGGNGLLIVKEMLTIPGMPPAIERDDID